MVPDEVEVRTKTTKNRRNKAAVAASTTRTTSHANYLPHSHISLHKKNLTNRGNQ